MRLTRNLAELLSQLKEQGLESPNEEAQSIIQELEAVGQILDDLGESRLRIMGFDTIVPFQIGPRPTHCKLCGHRLR